ncbi:MAG: helix-turn-helix domain-containing protein [Marinobacter adhaerens]|nr:helix-turn-helix domain-containing protein [Marinobacter adhaerens]
MNIQTYIQQVGPEVAAKTLGVSVSAIKHYRNGIRRIAPWNVISTCAATGWKVTPHEARPDIYPNSTDGLPPPDNPGEAA